MSGAEWASGRKFANGTERIAAYLERENQKQADTEKEAKAIMRLPTEERKKYYANVSQSRGQRAAEELMWAVKRERFSTKEMER